MCVHAQAHLVAAFEYPACMVALPACVPSTAMHARAEYACCKSHTRLLLTCVCYGIRTLQARSYFRSGQRLGSHVFELWYNGALSAQHQGDLQAALEQAQAAVEAYPEHADSKALLQSLRTQLMAL